MHSDEFAPVDLPSGQNGSTGLGVFDSIGMHVIAQIAAFARGASGALGSISPILHGAVVFLGVFLMRNPRHRKTGTGMLMTSAALFFVVFGTLTLLLVGYASSH